MRLVYFSDLHDREYTWKKLDVRGDSAYALQQITNYAMDTTDVAAVVSGGDLLHSAINRSAVPVRLIRQIRELHTHDIHFLFINGNHDATDPPWASACAEAIHLHDTVYGLDDGITIGGIDSCGRDSFYEHLQTMREEKPDILVVHQLWENWTNFGGPTMCGDVRELHDSCRLLLTGDMHKYATLQVQNRSTSFTAVSSGAATRQKMDEPEQNWFLDITATADEIRVDAKPLLSRPFLLLDANGPDDAEWCVDQIRQLLADSAAFIDQGMPPEVAVPIVKLSYASSVDVQSVMRKAFVPGMVHFMYERKILSKGGSLSHTTKPEAMLTMVDAIDEALADDTDLGAIAKQLWETDDAAGLLDAFVDQEVGTCT